MRTVSERPKRSIGEIANGAKEELREAFYDYFGYEIHEKPKKSKRKQKNIYDDIGSTTLSTFTKVSNNLDFINHLLENCDSLREYLTLSDKSITVAEKSTLLSLTTFKLVLKQKDIYYAIPIDSWALLERATPELLREMWNREKPSIFTTPIARKLISSFGNMTGEQIVEKISKGLKK